jgi:glutamine cyclotransferase
MRFIKFKYIVFFAVSALLFSCTNDGKNTASSSAFAKPESGELIKLGDPLKLKLNFADGLVDSVAYFIDNQQVAAKDTAALTLDTKDFLLGSRLITAKIYRKGVTEEATTNVVIISNVKPEQYRYEIVKTYPHDVNSYTEGLEYIDGVLYESAGEYKVSRLFKTTLDGKILKEKKIEPQYFAEGITVIGDKIIQLTYKEKVGFEYDKNTFELLKTFPYNHANEGWGLCFNGETIFNTDGSNHIFFLDKNTYLPTGGIDVYDDRGPVTSLNELEWVEGKLYANIYGSELIAIINPKNGVVEAYINLIGLPHGPLGDEDNDVLNGIAYDSKGKRLFVTGKKWDKLFEIKLVKI